MNLLVYKSTDYQFYKNYYLQIINSRKLSSDYHSHDFYEIIFLVAGKCTQKINDLSYFMNSGDYVILSPGDSHCFISQSENLTILCLSVTKNEFSKIAYSFDIQHDQLSNIVLYSTAEDKKNIYRCAQKCLFNSDIRKYKLLLGNFLSRIEHNKQHNAPEILIKLFEQMTALENLSSGIPAMLKISGYSKSHLFRLIKEHTGLSIHDYLLNLRLETAYQFILHTDKPIEQIAESLGYNSLSHFIKIFKTKYNLTPIQLRKSKNIPTM